MKTLGRILIILAVTALVTAALYLIFDSGAAGDATGFGPRGEGGRHGPSGPGFGGGTGDFEGRHLGRGEGEEVVTSLFLWVRNVGLIALIVAAVVLPQSWMRRKRMTDCGAEPGDSASA